jgi:hypothetical protein
MQDESGEQPQSGRSFWRKRSKGKHDAPIPDTPQQPASESPASQASDTKPTAVGDDGAAKKQRPRKPKKPTLVLTEEQELVFTAGEEPPPLVNPDWRDARKQYTGKFQKKWGILSASPQELQLWLQEGGWRFVAGGAFLVVLVLVIFLTFTHQADQQTGTLRDPTTGEPGSVPPSQLTLAPLESTTNEQQPPATDPNLEQPPASMQQDAPPAPDTPSNAPPAVVNEPSLPVFMVVGTAGQGLRLRAMPDSNSALLATVPDNSRVQQIGADVTGSGYVWRNVRTPEGVEGWVAIDWLQPVP